MNKATRARYTLEFELEEVRLVKAGQIATAHALEKLKHAMCERCFLPLLTERGLARVGIKRAG